MAGIIRKSKISILPDYNTIGDIESLNNFKGFGVAYAYQTVGLGAEGNVFCIPFANKEAVTQIFVGYTGTPRKIRTLNWSTQTWSDWESL